MSAELFEVLSLAARYLFVLLGALIVLRAFLWLLSERVEARGQRRRMRDSGFIGEMVVLSGGPGLREGTVIPVPWEGSLGSVRSCDMVVPCAGVRRRHLWFSWEEGAGLHIQPLSGCEAVTDQVSVDCRSWKKTPPMVHGSFLQVGSALLRLRVFAGLDSAAGFPEDEALFDPAAGQPPAAAMDPSLPPPPAGQMLPEGVWYPPAVPGPLPGPIQSALRENEGFPYGPAGFPVSPSPQAGPDAPARGAAEPGPVFFADQAPPPGPAPEAPSSPVEMPDTAPPAAPVKNRRRRRSDRWEEDWSE